jgi:hypothetical protein
VRGCAGRQKKRQTATHQAGSRRPGCRARGRSAASASACARLVRVASEAGHDFPCDGDCIHWVILYTRAFDRDWLDRFFAAPLPLPASPAPAAPPTPARRYGRLALQEWWGLLTPQVLFWGRQQRWGCHGDGVLGLLGEAYVRAASLWDEVAPTFPQADEVSTQSREAVFAWFTRIVAELAARHPPLLRASLIFEPEAPADDPGTAGTATQLPDRVLVADRVRWLSARLPAGVPELEQRIGGRGTLQLLIVADQLEVALGLPDRASRQWCLQTLVRQTPAEVAADLGTTANYVQRRFGDIRQAAQERLARLWCPPHATPASAAPPGGNETHE